MSRKSREGEGRNLKTLIGKPGSPSVPRVRPQIRLDAPRRTSNPEGRVQLNGLFQRILRIFISLSEYILLATGSLFVIVDPLATAPSFLAMTPDDTPEHRI